ncbi:hypothetical protein [Pseudoalteromonas viridis]|uniref:Uncharacterized protein n=1 Tax=Pseudoalteromonas viridis TaxID=339617 RepID=A0ABX7VA81_9GAMM|nr:hypothetical protein [Pseudoalteromonas viridis]QTL35389.1 hypothetical protein J5X90_18065 [Pseudoalteromonas viridis]
MKKPLIAVAALFLSHNALAVSNSMPTNCKYGRSAPYDVNAADVGTAVADGFEVYGNPYSPQAWSDFFDSLSTVLNSFDYLRVEVPKHVIRGSSFRAKGNLFDKYAYVHFHNSEKGHIGKDKSNLDSNSYHNMSFDRTNGYGLVWITRGELCSAEGVWVQNRPKTQYKSAPRSRYGNNVTVTVGWDLDKYSKVGRLGAGANARIWVQARGADGIGAGSSKAISTIKGSTTFSFQSSQAGLHTVDAWVYDGTFYSPALYLGRVDVEGTPLDRPCPTCPPY